MSFTITKIATNNFTHFDGFKEMNFSNWEINFNNTTNTIILQLRNGAPFPKREVLASEVIIKDGIIGTPETFSTTEQIRTRLLALNYNPLQSSGSGGGAVDSVNGQTGVVVLDADDISETATRKWQSANQDSFNDATSSIQGQLDAKFPLNPRVQSVTSSATVTPTSTNDIVTITAQAVALTLANPTGTFAEGQALMIRIKDNGTARAITFGSNYRAIGVTLPTTTTINKTLYLGVIYNSTDAKWDVLGINLQA